MASCIQQTMAQVLFVMSCLVPFEVQDFPLAIVQKSIPNAPITTYLYIYSYNACVGVVPYSIKQTYVCTAEHLL